MSNTATATLADKLGQVRDLDEQLDELDQLGQRLDDAGADVLPAVLAMFERVGLQDDFGVFHAFGDWIEMLDPDEEVGGKSVAEHLVESVARSASWKTLEVAERLVDPDALIEALEPRVGDESITEREHEMIVYTLEGLGVDVDLSDASDQAVAEEPPELAPADEDDEDDQNEKAWWDRPVRDGVVDLWEDVDDDKLDELIAHADQLADAPWAISPEKLDDIGRLAELGRPIIWKRSWSDRRVIDGVPRLREVLYGIHEAADYDSPIYDEPSIFHDLSELRIFDVRLTQLDADSFGQILETLPMLEELTISQRAQFGALERIAHPERLHTLLAKEVWGCRMDEDPLGADELAALARFENLRRVDFSLVHLASDALGALAENRALESLRATGVKWPKADWSFFESLSSLKTLSVQFSDNLPAKSAGYISELTNLRVFDAPGAKVGATGAKALAELEHLEELTVAGFRDKELARVAELPNLRRLDLRKAKITDDGVAEHLGDLDRLEAIGIRRAPITDAAIAALPRTLEEIEFKKIDGLTEACVDLFDEFEDLEKFTFADGPRGLTDKLEAAMKQRGVTFSSYAF